MHRLMVLFAMAAVLCLSEAKMFDRCGLVNELRGQGLPENQMGDWVCLIENESGRNTGATNRNTDGSIDYGIFQINNQYWCSESGDPGKDCNITCEELLSDDITAAVQCARVIYNRHAFQAWYGWINNCQTGLPDISSC